MADPILPTPDSLVTPFIDAIVAQRPEALQHFNSGGRWSHLSKMLRAQAVVALSRMADEVKSARLRFATGQSLRALCASEFNTTLPPDPQLAYGEVELARPSPGSASGIIPAGSRIPFVKRALPNGLPFGDPNAYPLPVASATYDVVAPVYIASGQLTAVVKIVAVTPGAEANVPLFVNGPPTYLHPTLISPGTPLFDTTITVTSVDAAGGSSGVTDAVLVAAARAHAIGQFGPTDGAIVAGLLEQQAVRRYASFPATAFLPYAQVYIADESWASSNLWVNRVAQHFADNWQGFGCRARFGPIVNYTITISPTIVLANSDSLNDTEAIDANVRAAAKSYFDDRPDFYSFRLSSLKAAIAAADPRILHCSSVSVIDAITGAEIPEPQNSFGTTATFQTTWSPFVVHWYLVDNGVQSTYMPPS